MKFNECLSNLMFVHGLKAIDIHRLTDLKKPYISKMLNGDLIPSSYGIVEKIMNTAGFSVEEKLALTDAYQMTRSSEHGKQIWRSFSSLFLLKDPKLGSREPEKNESNLKNAEVLFGGDLTQTIRHIVKCSGIKLTLFFSPVTGEGAKAMCQIFANISDDTALDWLMPFNELGMVSVEDLKVISESLPLLSIKACSVRKYVCNTNALLKSSLFPFFVLSESSLVIFDKDIGKGQYFDDEKLIRLYQEAYSDHDTLECKPFMSSFNTPQDAITSFGNEMMNVLGTDYDYYTFAKVPCIVFDLSESLLSKYVADDLDKASISKMYYSLLNNIISSAKSFTDIFSLYGIVDFLDSEEFYEIGKHFSKSLDKDFRRKTLAQFIGQAQSETDFETLGMKIPGFERGPFFGANILSTGILLLLYDFEEKTVVITVKDKSIVDMIISYINDLRKYGLIATKEETIELVSKALKERNISE